VTTTPPARAGRPVGGHGSPLIARRGLLERLSTGGPAGVTLVSAPAGSGKTVLLRSWIDEAGLADHVAWVTVERGERDPQRFWLAVVERLRTAVGADAFVEKLTPAPEFDGEAMVKRLVSELGSLEEPVLLVIDDLQELQSPVALAQLGLLIDRRPRLLHIVLATRRDPQLGLHRLRLAGELTEVRAADLRFSLDETRELFAASGIASADEALVKLHARTEGWAAGLRLAALSLAGHPDPERFVAEFSGSERTVADYLLAEVLQREPEDVRRLLLRTSILERVSGALADALVEATGSERILLELEQANAFVVCVDAERTWFRYHELFADLLRLELRRAEPGVVPELQRRAAAWLEEHGLVADAIRHAQAATDWPRAARLVADHSFSLSLDGQDATMHALLAAFPEHALSDPELARAFASDQLIYGTLDGASTYLALAERHASEVPDERRHLFDLALGVARMSLARRRGDFESVLEEVRPLLDPATAETAQEVVLGNDARAVALMNLGAIELWSFRHDEAERHLEQGLELARRIGRPYIQIGCLAYLALAAGQRSFIGERKRCLEAIAIAEAHGWQAEPIACVALATLGAAAVYQGRFEEAQSWLERADRALRPDLEPAEALLIHFAQGIRHIGQGRLHEALAAFRVAEQYQAKLVRPHLPIVLTRQLLVHTQRRLGDMAAAQATLAEFSDEDREWGEARAAIADLHLADGDARAAVDVLAPVLAGQAPVLLEQSTIQALLLDAIARDQLGESQAAETGIERALDLAEPTGHIFSFVLAPIRDLLERHPRHRTTHAALLSDILDVLDGLAPSVRAAEPPTLQTDLTESELRVLRYLPSNLSAPEIASELYVSTSTVKTHMLHIYAKLEAHRRTEAVERARELGLLTPLSAHRR
jgi:LuxR family transcriptional regulator, maltose regulon positive regulatory protein